MTAANTILTQKLLNRGFADIEISLFVQDVVRILQSRPDVSLMELGNRLTSLGWHQVDQDTALIQLVREHLLDSAGG